MNLLALAHLTLIVSTMGMVMVHADELHDKGHAILQENCAGCHAIGKTGDSPHVGAPRFREIDRRYDLDQLYDSFRAGISAPHPDMPTFRFSRQDARAVIAYLRSIQN